MLLLLESFKELNKAMKLVRDRFYISGSLEMDTLQALTVLEEVDSQLTPGKGYNPEIKNGHEKHAY